MNLRQRYFVSSMANGKNDVTDADIEKINGMTKNGPLKPLKKEEIFTRRMYILGEEPTSKLSIHPEGKKCANGETVNILSEIAETLVGCPMMEGHRLDKRPWGRIYDVQMLGDVAGYKGKVILVSYYFLLADGGERRAARIDGGIDAEGSVQYRFKTAHCSICDKEMMISSFLGMTLKRMKCRHEIGKVYDGVTCYWYPKGMMSMEVSMVFAGAYPKTKGLLSVDDIPQTQAALEMTYACETVDQAYEMALMDAVIANYSNGGDDNGGQNGGTGSGGDDDDDTGNDGGAGNNGNAGGAAGSVGVTDWNKTVAECSQAIKPFKSGAQNNEFFELSGFENLTGVHHVEPKYDGVFMVLIKRSGKVKIITDSMSEHTKKFPGLVADVEKMKADNFILHGEMVKYTGKKRGTHADVSAYLQSKGPYEDYHLRYKPFDVAVMEGNDVRNMTLVERRKVMSGIKATSHLHPVKYLTADGGAKIIEAIKKAMTREGAMVKAAGMKLNAGGRKKIMKWKRQAVVDARVAKVNEKKNGFITFTCEVGAETGKSYTEIGETYVTKTKANVGDIITVSVDKVTYDEATKKFTWYAPKVLYKRSDKKTPDPASVLKRIAERKVSGSGLSAYVLQDVITVLNSASFSFNLYLVGGMVANGRSDHDVDLLTTEPLSEDEKQEVVEAMGEDFAPYLDFTTNSSGAEGLNVFFPGSGRHAAAGTYAKRFVLQRHSWGKAVHYDLRFGSKDGRKMWGFTCFNEPSKIAGPKKVRCEEKDYHDVKWMDFEGTIKPGDPGNPTKNLTATMKTLDKGTYDFIKRTGDFLEVVLHGKTWKGRYVFRKIEVSGDDKNALLIKGDESGSKGTIWILWKPLNQKAQTPVGVIKHCFNDGRLLYWEY